jgi:hypothetical protein
MNSRLNNHAGALALAALCLALIAAVGGVASAAGVFVTSKQIKNGTILSQDIKNNQVKSDDLKNDSVASADIGNGDVSTADIGEGQVSSGDIGEGEVKSGDIGSNQVTPSDVNLPPTVQIVEPPKDIASATVGSEFALVDPVGTYNKVVVESQLEISWTGSAVAAGITPQCKFQLRVDGNAVVGAGELFTGAQVWSGTVAASFDGLGAGNHTIEVWAKSTVGSSTCTVGPIAADIGQTFTIAEQVS